MSSSKKSANLFLESYGCDGSAFNRATNVQLYGIEQTANNGPFIFIEQKLTLMVSIYCFAANLL